jgi:hypothetical protein
VEVSISDVMKNNKKNNNFLESAKLSIKKIMKIIMMMIVKD